MFQSPAQTQTLHPTRAALRLCVVGLLLSAAVACSEAAEQPPSFECEPVPMPEDASAYVKDVTWEMELRGFSFHLKSDSTEAPYKGSYTSTGFTDKPAGTFTLQASSALEMQDDGQCKDRATYPITFCKIDGDKKYIRIGSNPDDPCTHRRSLFSKYQLWRMQDQS